MLDPSASDGQQRTLSIGAVVKKVFLAVLLLLSNFAYAQHRPGFIPIPAGQQIVLKTDTQDVPLGPLSVTFTKGWSFHSQGPLFAGLAPNGQLKFEATFAYDSKAIKDTSAQDKFASDNRLRLPTFQTEFVSGFGDMTKPCAEQLLLDGRFRYICTAARQHDGKKEYLIAYAYVGKWAILFLNFYGQDDISQGFNYIEDILKTGKWQDVADTKAK